MKLSGRSFALNPGYFKSGEKKPPTVTGKFLTKTVLTERQK